MAHLDVEDSDDSGEGDGSDGPRGELHIHTARKAGKWNKIFLSEESEDAAMDEPNTQSGGDDKSNPTPAGGEGEGAKDESDGRGEKSEDAATDEPDTSSGSGDTSDSIPAGGEEEGAKGEECQREEKALEKAEDKIANAQEELNKEAIRTTAAEATELENRAAVTANAEEEETEDEKISEEGWDFSLMVARVPMLPRIREPAGLARSTATIAQSRLHWFTFYLAVWLCVAALGLCVSSTRSLKAGGTRIQPTASHTRLSSATHSASPLRAQYPHPAYQQKHTRGWDSAACRITGPWHPSATAVPRTRFVRRALAAVSPGEGKWIGDEGGGLDLPSLLTPVNGSVGALRWQGTVPILGKPKVRSLLQSVTSALFSSLSVELPDCIPSSGANVESNGNEGNGSYVRREHQHIEAPTAPHVAQPVQDADPSALSLRGVPARLKRVFVSFIRSVRGAGTTSKWLGAGNGADLRFQSEKLPIPESNKNSKKVENSVFPFRPCGSTATYVPGCVFPHDSEQHSVREETNNLNTDAHTRMTDHPPDSGASQAIQAANLSVLSTVPASKITRTQSGFISPNGTQLQGRGTGADEYLNEPVLKSQIRHPTISLSDSAVAAAGSPLSGPSVALQPPGVPAQAIAASREAPTLLLEAPESDSLLAPRLAAETPSEAISPSAVGCLPPTGVTPDDVADEKGTQWVARPDRASDSPGKRDALPERGGTVHPPGENLGSDTSAQGSKIVPDAERFAEPALSQNAESGTQGEREVVQLRVSSVQSDASRVAESAPGETQWKETKGRKFLPNAEKASADQASAEFDLTAAVSDQLLSALQGNPAQQALAARALLALVKAEASRRATQAQACVALAGGSQYSSPPYGFLDDQQGRGGSQIDRLLQKGLLAVLERILSRPAPKSFWPRWLQRDADPTSKQEAALLHMQIHALQVLDLLAASGTDVERHIAGHMPLMRAVDRLAHRPQGAAEQVDADPVAVPSHHPKNLSMRSKPKPKQLNEGANRNDGEMLLSGDTNHAAKPALAEESEPASKSLSDDDSMPSETRVPLQTQSDPVLVYASHLENQDAVERPTAVTEHFSSGCPAQILHQASPQSGNKDHVPGVPSVAESTESPVAPPLNSTHPVPQASAAPSGKALSPDDGTIFSDSQTLRYAAGNLASELLARLGEWTGAAAAREPADCKQGTPVGYDGAAKPAWWRSFLFTRRSRADGLPVQLNDGRTSRGNAAQAAHELGSSTLAQSMSFPPPGASEDNAEPLHAGSVHAPRAREAWFEFRAKSSFLGGAFGARIAVSATEYWRRLWNAGIGRSLKDISGRTTALNQEPRSEVFWIPVCLSAGDAGVWAAAAAVAGEGLAGAMKRTLQEKVQNQIHTSDPQQAATVGGDSGLPQRNSEFLAMVSGARIESTTAASRQPATWGVLGVAIEDSPPDSQSDVRRQQEEEQGTHASDLRRITRQEKAVVLDGHFDSQISRKQFRVLCLLTGHQPFQESVQTLGVRALLSAASRGKPETKLNALQTLAQLLRCGAPGVIKTVSHELQSERPGSDIRLRSLDKGIAEAVTAPYTTGPWWRPKGDGRDLVVLEKLQVAALEFLYALCTDDETSIRILQECHFIRAAISRVIRFCTRTLNAAREYAASNKGSAREASESNGSMGDEQGFIKVSNMLPPAERHTRVLQEHARPLRLATIISAALGAQPKWKPRMPGQRGLRILALDGGGTRGVLTVALLKHVAAAVGSELSDVFDIICGTSTGGIIAVLLGMEKASVAELEALYDTLISEIFVKDSAAVAGARLVVRQAYYDESLWESLLKRAFSETRMIDFAADKSVPKVFCLSTMVSTTPARLVVWRNYNYPCSDHSTSLRWVPNCFRRITRMLQEPGTPPEHQEGGRYDGSCCVRVRDALRATTAAPGFFIGKKIGNELFVDGALLANNPAAVAIAEAKALYPGVPIEAVVSIGTGQCSEERCDTRTGWDGIFNQLVNAATNTEAIHELLRDLLPHSVYFRFNPEIDSVSIDETSKGRLDGLKLAAKRYFEDPKNSEAMQRLADILRPESPIQKKSKSFVRRMSSKAASFLNWIRIAGSRPMQAIATSIKSPVKASDSSFLRLIKCSMAPAQTSSNAQTTENVIIEPGASAKKTAQDRSESSATAATAAALPETERPLVGTTTEVKDGAVADDDILNDPGVVTGRRRSFLAWLLRSSKSKLGTGSGGIFDMLELLGRRQLSSIHEEEMETLVPLTGVRHVLHGIFQNIQGQS